MKLIETKINNIFLKTKTIGKDKKSSERLILNSQTNATEKIKKNDTKKKNLSG